MTTPYEQTLAEQLGEAAETDPALALALATIDLAPVPETTDDTP